MSARRAQIGEANNTLHLDKECALNQSICHAHRMLNACTASDSFDPCFMGVDMDAAEAELATLDAHINAAIHRRLELIRLIDASGRWAERGPKSCAHWLSWRLNLEPGTAREQVRVANRLAELPRLDEELKHARVTYSQVRAITRVATGENEARLIELAKVSTAAQLERIVRGVREVNAQVDGTADGSHTLDRWVRQRPMGDGTARVEAQLTVDEAALLMEAIQTMRSSMRAEQVDATAQSVDAPSAPKPSFADALVRMAEEVEAHDRAARETSRTGGERTSLVLHLAPDLLAPDSPASDDAASGDSPWSASLDDGTRVSAETFRRLACDCSLIAVSGSGDERGDGLDVGRKTRKVPAALRRAITLRDRGCAFPGCTHDRFVDCHHIEHWADGGATSKDNLITLCTFHHRLVHEGGWSLAFDAERNLELRAPDGRSLPRVHRPSPEQRGERLLEQLLLAHVELALDDETAFPMWSGEPPDYDACVAAVRGPGSERSTGSLLH
ncbi:MAG: DUF222 domain-containing protein [Sandaracinaceae bacterium]|nr:DUF222 domain-containing protein [Sandaracinaceae bacterium]